MANIKKITFLAKGDSELHWSLEDCSCANCKLFTFCVLRMEREVSTNYIPNNYNEKLRSLVCLLKECDIKHRVIRVSVTDDKEELKNVIFIHVPISRTRVSSCVRKNYYLYDLERNVNATYACKNAMKTIKII